MVQLSQTTQQNASSSEELAATAEEMSAQAEQLQETMSFFKLAGPAHVRAANTTIASARKSALRRRPAPRAGAALSGRPAATIAGEAAEVDESDFARF